MDSSQRFLQTNEKLFSNFEFVFELMAKTEKIFKRIARRESIKVHAMCYISMDLPRQALQTNGKLFFKFLIRF